MPTFEFREWLVGLIVAVVFCFALTPLAAQGVRWLRPFAWLYAVIHLLNAIGHTVGNHSGPHRGVGDVSRVRRQVLFFAISA